MIIRASLTGIVLWFAALIAFRFSGARFFIPEDDVIGWFYLGAPFVMIALTWALLKALRVAPGDQAEAAIGLAIPGMLFSAFTTSKFSLLLPAIDPLMDATFAAVMLEANAFMLFAGILFTRLAPQDEKL